MGQGMKDLETLWRIIRGEAAERAAGEPVLASFYHANILNHEGLDDALSYHMASQLGCDSVPAMLLREVADLAYRSDPGIVQAAAADIQNSAVHQRKLTATKAVVAGDTQRAV